MKNKKQNSQFRKLILGLLAIFAAESAIYFAQSLFNPPTTYAQSTESSQSAAEDFTPGVNQSLSGRDTPGVFSSSSIKLPILIYHYVEYVTDERDTIRQSLNINPHTFENQITTLKDAGYTFITPSDIENLMESQKIRKPIIISFDDGYEDFYTDVLPIIKRQNVKVVAYIVPGFLDKLNYMTWKQVKEISSSGLVEIGAHTMHHASLGSLSDDLATTEINDGKMILELSLGKKITAFAYPYGHFNNETPNLVESAGFTSAVSTEEGTNENVDSKFLLKRIHPGARVGQDLITIFN